MSVSTSLCFFFRSIGVESGFVTLPRLSRSERPVQTTAPSSCSAEMHRGSLTHLPVTLTVPDSLSPSDSMTSFTVDLGPSLMSEVFAMIDGPIVHVEASHISEMEHKPEPWANGETEMTSHTRPSLVDSLLREDSEGRSHLYGVEWGCGDVMNGKSLKPVMVGDLVRSYTAKEHGMEAKRFQEAADVLARHYGSGTNRKTDTSITQRRQHYAYLDEEEEIKV